MSVRDYYDQYWSAHGFHPTGQTTPALERIFERWVPRGGHCLDVGCGDGRTSGLWLLHHGCLYEGVDVSTEAVAEARGLGLQAQRIDDAGTLPFADGSFDVVVCVEVLEHLFSPLEAVREMARVLRPGGLLIVTVPNVAYWRRRLELLLLGRWNPLGDDRAVLEPWRDPHIRFFNRGSMRRMIASAGLSPIVVGGHGSAMLIRLPEVALASLARVFPSLFGERLHAVARRQGLP